MATQNNPQDEPVDFDDLLNLTQDDEEQPTPAAEAEKPKRAYNRKPKPEATPEETPEQKKIRELQAALAAPLPSFKEEDEAPQELTPEQKKIKELEDLLAKRNAQIAEKVPAEYVAAQGDTILIHVVQDGFTALGQVWHRGQEMEFEVGGAAYEQTKDRNGFSWVDLAGDVHEQYRRWKRQWLALGPFRPLPGEKFEDEVAKADERRKRAVPLIRR